MVDLYGDYVFLINYGRSTFRGGIVPQRRRCRHDEELLDCEEQACTIIAMEVASSFSGVSAILTDGRNWHRLEDYYP